MTQTIPIALFARARSSMRPSRPAPVPRQPSHTTARRMPPKSRARPPKPPERARHLFTRPFALFLVLRIVNAFVVRTFFVADEFWQSAEVAHALVYGYGHATWEWRARLRSHAHPLLYAAVYKLGDVVGLRSDAFVRNAPRVVGGFIAAAHDAGCGRLGRRFGGEKCEFWSLALRAMNWFVFYCETRGLSNCAEACATTWALAYWPLDGLGRAKGGARRRRKALSFAAIACVMRPTSGILWLALGASALARRGDPVGEKARFALLEAAPIGAFALAASACVDRYFYGEWTFVPWNFVKFNFLSGKSAIYGANPWHWYLTQGYPAVLGTMLPLALIGFWRNRVKNNAAFAVTFWTLFGYSLAAHKEFRFVLPCVSASIVSAASVLTEMMPSRRRLVLLALALTNVPAALYMSLRHQAGTIALMPHIADLAKQGAIVDGGVLFAVPCHQTPFYSHVHREIRMEFLDCSPDIPEGEDDSARFASDPETWLNARFGRTVDDSHRTCAVASALAPSHVALFDGDARRAAPWLERWNYALERTFHHADVAVDREIQRALHLYARPPHDASACRAQT